MAPGESSGLTSGRDRERQRVATSVSFTVEQTVTQTAARNDGAAPRRTPCLEQEQGSESERRRNRSWAAPSSARSSGVGLPQGGPAPVAAGSGAGFGSLSTLLRRLVSAAQAARLGNPAIWRGARYEKSVAEVGEKHLPRNPEGSREANRGGRAVARRGGSVPDEGSFIASGELVRGRVQRT
jgi:hypothetical protein